MPPFKDDHLAITDRLRVSPASTFHTTRAKDAPINLPLRVPPRGTARHQRTPPRDSSPVGSRGSFRLFVPVASDDDPGAPPEPDGPL
eukprot:15468438-Alexandrium_andersonii.AAC.1